MNYQQVLALIQQFIVANGNNEITANVLRPILEAILAQPNELIGDLDDLQTSDQSNLVNAINEVLNNIAPQIGSVNTKIHPLSLSGIDPDLSELTKIVEAVKLRGPFTCDVGQQMVFKTITTVGDIDAGAIVITRYYRLLRNLTTIGGPSTYQNIPVSWFMQDGVSEYANPDADGTIIELGDIGTSEVWDVFNLGDNGDAWDMNEYRFVRATQNGNIQLWAFVGQERYYGGTDMGVEPDIFEAFEDDFFLITDEDPNPIDLSTGLEAIDEGNGIGWRLIGRNPANYGNIGEGAIDLGASDSASNSVGATGDYSTVGGGQANEASGIQSTVGGGNQNKASYIYSTVSGGHQNEASDANSTVGGGLQNKASGTYSSVGGGAQNEASGYYSAVSGGIYNIAKTFGEFLGGLYSTIKEGSANSWVGTDRIFGIGNGTSELDRSDAFNVYKNGVAELPSATNSLIDAAGAKAVTTKEYVDRKEIKEITATTYTLLETDNNKILHFTSATDVTVTVPAGLTIGNRYEGKQLGDGQIIFVGATGVIVNTLATKNNKTEDKYSVFKLDSTDTDDYVLYGELELVGRESMHLSYNPTTSLNLLIQTDSRDDWEIDWGDGVWERYVSSAAAYRTKTFSTPTAGIARVRSATGRGLSDIDRVESNDGTWSFDATALSGLTSLTFLRLEGTGFTGDMTALSGLTSLTFLQLVGNGFTGDMTGVSGLTLLTTLRLQGNGFTGDMTGVSGLTSLTYLYLFGSGFTGDMTGVSGLTSLTYLVLNSGSFTGDMTGVSGLTSLTYLYLEGSFTGDMSGVSGLTLLTFLRLSGSFTGDMTGVSGLTSLTTLRLQGSGFTLTYSTFTANLQNLFFRLQTGELSNPADIDQLFIDLDSVATSKSGSLDVRSAGAAAPTAASSAARNSLVSKGRTILTN